MAKRILQGLVCNFIGHRWNAWDYMETDKCGQRRSCLRCSESETRGPIHDWSAWTDHKAGDCAQTRTCTRCKTIENRGPIHDWTDWDYVRADECGQQRTCLKCKKAEKRGPIHEWEPFVDNVRKCVRCSATEQRPSPIENDDVKYEDPCADIAATCSMGCDPG